MRQLFRPSAHPGGHPGLSRLFGRNYRIDAEPYADRMQGDLVEAQSANPSERAYQRYLPDAEHLPESHRRKWLYYKLFPNIAFDLYPDQVDFMQFIPMSQQRPSCARSATRCPTTAAR